MKALWERRFGAKISRIGVDRLENADLDRVLPQQRSHAALPGDMDVDAFVSFRVVSSLKNSMRVGAGNV